MFYNCFQNNATLICKASTIQKIKYQASKINKFGDSECSCLIIPDEKNTLIKNIIGNNENLDQIYKCSVKRVGSNPEITEVEQS